MAAVITDDKGRPRFSTSGVAITGQHAPDSLEQLSDDLAKVADLVGTSLIPQKPTLTP